VVEKACDVQMDYGGYTETRILYVVQPSGRVIFLNKAVLTALNALFPAGPKPVIIQPEGMACFPRKESGRAGRAMWQVTSSGFSIEDEVPDYLLPLFKFIVSAMSYGERREFNALVEFA